MAEIKLRYGEKITHNSGNTIYSFGDDPGEKCVYYVIAGLVKIELKLPDNSNFQLYLHPNSLFGIIEPITKSKRLTAAYTMEQSILYCWDMANFQMASSVCMELAFVSFTGLTRMLRIMNAEFGEKSIISKRTE